MMSANAAPAADDEPGSPVPVDDGAPAAKAPTLVLEGLQSILSGFEENGFVCLTAPDRNYNNPTYVDVRDPKGERRFTIWVFKIEGGGGGPTVRSPTERRIQESNGPETIAAMAGDGRIHLLVGYENNEDVLCVFDQRYITDWIENYQANLALPKPSTGPHPGKPSPSRHVHQSQLLGLDANTIRPYVRDAAVFPDRKARNYIMKPTMLPQFLGAVEANGTYAGALTGDASPTTATDIVGYCKANGYHFDPDLIARYVASLSAKPFVILAGISGTGKSKLAELVAEFYAGAGRTAGAATAAAAPTPSRTYTFAAPGLASNPAGTASVALVPVRPDWLDNKSVLGFVNPITDQYESTATLDIILRAAASPADRHFLILDEMNLAKVEHYFSDWLACTESRRYRPDGTIHQQGVPLHRRGTPISTSMPATDGTVTKFDIPASLLLPTNLAVTGTVNVDESTHGFSPKVLDRAMVIEFDDVDLDGLRDDAGATAAPAPAPAPGTDYRFPPTLPDFRLATSADYAAMPDPVHDHLVAINRILEKPRLHVGYRAATEMALFMGVYNAILPEADVDDEWLVALDAALLQKVLPRVGGNRVRLERALALLCHYLRDLTDLSGATVPPDRKAYAATDNAKLGRSYRRALEMWDTLIEFGYVSFFK
ncbi:hypothetical protein [Methylobacterium adhaesivum]|uniref:Uncharacterized protein n=1 Tax=Methylobacterium adhaesivum TaxID=333297 RepID=A0ABT8BLK9_9HYPH|nr:hypothetical protein [Methylobacterium adhaesivum]MDN3592402.1 hypothetical protein [Methylobacterium adhaesivum]